MLLNKIAVVIVVPVSSFTRENISGWVLGALWASLFSVASVAAPIPAPKRSAEPVLNLNSEAAPATVVSCLQRGMTGLKIPSDFVHTKRRADGGVSVMLAHRASGRKGPIVDVSPLGKGSWVRLYDNGMVLSRQWQDIVRRCAV
jgi:hypothetical protein